jgi:hypothetical protein
MTHPNEPMPEPTCAFCGQAFTAAIHPWGGYHVGPMPRASEEGTIGPHLFVQPTPEPSDRPSATASEQVPRVTAIQETNGLRVSPSADERIASLLAELDQWTIRAGELEAENERLREGRDKWKALASNHQFCPRSSNLALDLQQANAEVERLTKERGEAQQCVLDERTEVADQRARLDKAVEGLTKIARTTGSPDMLRVIAREYLSEMSKFFGSIERERRRQEALEHNRWLDSAVCVCGHGALRHPDYRNVPQQQKNYPCEACRCQRFVERPDRRDSRPAVHRERQTRRVRNPRRKGAVMNRKKGEQ